jgi:hypothetical protein
MINMFKRKKVEPKLEDVYWYFSSKDFNAFTWKSRSLFNTKKHRWEVITIYVPIFSKWDLVRYKQVFVMKKDILSD